MITKHSLLFVLLSVISNAVAQTDTQPTVIFDDSDFAGPSAATNTSPINLPEVQINPTAEAPVQNDITLTAAPTVEPSFGSSGIALLLNDGVNPILWQGVANRLHSPKAVTQFYAKLNYRRLWTDNGQVTPLAAQVIQVTREAYQHALRPETYHANATSSLQVGQKIAEPDQFDIILSDAFITLKEHLANGIVNPKSQFETWNTPRENIDYVNLYLRAQQAGYLGDALSVLNPDYQILQQTYAAELGQATQEKPPVINAKKLSVGSRGQNVRLLRERLGLSGEIDIYDKDLKAAVKAYQAQHGLQADGIAGRNTILTLNSHSANHLEKLAINMERLRWAHIPNNEAYIWVNIPAFLMAVRDNNQWLFESKTVVGRPKRPTPVFSDVLENVVLAPYWNVPSTIFKEDKLPKLRKNPAAFGKNMQVINTRTGKVVNAASVDWSNGGKGYRLRQKPSGRNALGRMKFLFPNRHAIYLHDTPSKHLFKKSRRAYSSGCVRLARAEDFAVFLLKDMGYSRDRVKKESRRSKEKWINLASSKRYPVFLNYLTAWVDSGQRVRYSGDIYGYDKKMGQAYKKALQAL